MHLLHFKTNSHLLIQTNKSILLIALCIFWEWWYGVVLSFLRHDNLSPQQDVYMISSCFAIKRPIKLIHFRSLFIYRCVWSVGYKSITAAVYRVECDIPALRNISCLFCRIQTHLPYRTTKVGKLKSTSKSISLLCSSRRYILVSKQKQKPGLPLPTPLEEQLLAERFPSMGERVFRQHSELTLRSKKVSYCVEYTPFVNQWAWPAEISWISGRDQLESRDSVGVTCLNLVIQWAWPAGISWFSGRNQLESRESVGVISWNIAWTQHVPSFLKNNFLHEFYRYECSKCG